MAACSGGSGGGHSETTGDGAEQEDPLNAGWRWGHRLDSSVGFSPAGTPEGDRKAWSFSVVTGERQGTWDSAAFSLAEHRVG